MPGKAKLGRGQSQSQDRKINLSYLAALDTFKGCGLESLTCVR